MLYLRGSCPDTNIKDVTFVPMQLQDDQTGIPMIGRVSSQLKYNSSLSQWILQDSRSNTTAMTEASQLSYALGKNNWTIRGDSIACSKDGSPYTIEMKLTGCNKTEFTCDDGQCVRLDQRCNQLLNCRDKSDEKGCRFLFLNDGYNNRLPPITLVDVAQDLILPVNVKVSITLLKVVSIDEEDHSIEFQFEITLQWKENRATYHNLNTNMYLNALSLDDIKKLWLPLVIYANTDQYETTRLGMEWEWRTDVWVKREGNLFRSSFHDLDETEIFNGKENSLIMAQSYTHEFQCVYELRRYPFDTQACTSNIINI